MSEIREPKTTYREIARDWKDWYIGLVQGWQIWLVVALMQALALTGDVVITGQELSYPLIHVALIVYSVYKITRNW